MSQPPPQNVEIPAEIALQSLGFHAAATDLHRVDGVQAGIDQIGQQRAHRAAAVQHHLDVGQLLGARPHHGVARLEELAVHARRHLRAVLRAQVVAEADDVDVRPDRAEVTLQLAQVDLHQRVEKSMRALRLAGQHHQEVVHAVVELPHLEQVAAEQRR